MSCEKFRKYELGELREREFRKHKRRCAYCQEQVEQDAVFMSLARSIKQPVKAPLLWDRIRKSIEDEKVERIQPRRAHRIRFPVFQTAAVLVLVIAFGLYFWLKPETEEAKLLSKNALKRVEKKESAYIKAIEALEQSALPKMGDLDIELTLLYRDRLETINDQIERCKEALAENPANSHIRRYLLAALQDKKQTLKELLSSQHELMKRN